MLQFNNIIEVSNVSTISGLTREAKALYISNYFKKNNVSLLIVTSSTYESNYLFQAIKKYIPETLFFPMDDFLTSEAIAISPELESTRLETLNKLISTKNNIVVTNLMGYLRYLPLMKKYKDSLISISIGSEIDMKIFIQQLLLIGYEKNTLVEKTGDFAVRGFVIDIYPINFEYPIRIEFFGDEVDALHLFDPETQRTFEKIDNVIISPYTEFLIDTYEENPKQKNLPLYGTVTNISGYLPNSVIIYDNYTSLKVSYNLLMEEVMKYNEEQQLPLDTKYMHSFEELLSKKSIFFEKYDENLLNVNNTINYKMYSIDVFKNTTSFLTYLEKEQKKHKTIILCLSNRYSLNKVYDLLGNLSTIITNESEIYEDYINLIIKDISEGFIYLNYVVLSEREIFGKETSQVRYDSKFHYGNKIRNISHLNVGDYIVHMDYGIGKYLGLKSLSKNSIKKDYLVLEYIG